MAARGLHFAAHLSDVEAHLGDLDRLLQEVDRRGAALPRAVELRRVRTRLHAAVGRMVDPLRHRLERLRAAGDRPLAERWAELDDIANALEPLAAELVPVAQGALARAAGLDGGLCAVAERLIDTLEPVTAAGQRVVVPAPTERTSTRTWVIGLPVRDVSVWSLAIVGHELGHVVTSDLKDQFGNRLGDSLLDGSWRGREGLPPEAIRLPGPLPRSRASELFADVFATYCVGPAYAAALVVRSVPLAAWEPRGDHPAWGSRVRAALRVLEPTSLGWLAESIRDEWERSLCGVGETGDVPAPVAAAVDAFTDAAVEVMDATASRARFDARDEVLDLAERLRARRPPAQGADPRIVLNAAWAARFRDPQAMATIEADLREWQGDPPVVVSRGDQG